MTSDLLTAAKVEERRLEQMLREQSDMLQAVRRIIALYERPAPAPESERSEQKPPQTSSVHQVNGGFYGDSLAARIRAGAAEYLREKGGPATGGEIYRALVAKGIRVTGKRPTSIVTSRLSRSPLFQNTSDGYSLVEAKMSH